MASDVVGVWTLRSFVLEDVDSKERTEPLGPEPRGTLLLHPDGRLAALLTPRGRTAPITDADRAAAFRTMVAYSGRYRLEPPDRLVTSVDVAWFEGWIGTEQVRTYKLDGDRLEVVTPPARMPRPEGDGASVTAVLSWTREASMPIDEPRRISEPE